jgi:8-oxo-dGTP pyrophosphatase MutT (NUDIX family)
MLNVPYPVAQSEEIFTGAVREVKEETGVRIKKWIVLIV